MPQSRLYNLSEYYIPMTQSGPQWHEAWLWSSEDFVTTIQCGVLGPAQPARTPLAPLLAAGSNDLEHWLPVLALTGAPGIISLSTTGSGGNFHSRYFHSTTYIELMSDFWLVYLRNKFVFICCNVMKIYYHCTIYNYIIIPFLYF